ncbi:DUF2793 domain-containing protein [Qipengyuania sp. JC766]|uniref:DUF2793 domain-containing protein n=1 Tax=Qipengyuania sp. JC766 TaxID=3232139 RepID=UPI003458F2B2
MTDPIAFADRTHRHGLPLLFTGQAQKEAFVNEAFVRTDMLLHPVVKGIRPDPPASPEAGECWIVANPAAGSFAGREGTIAGWHAGSWHFAAPVPGLRAFDLSQGLFLHYRDEWRAPDAPTLPSGGTNIDAEMRAAFMQLLASLRTAGILSDI